MTEIWQDRQERGFLMFLAVFCILLPVLGILGSLWQAQGIRDALLGREARLVSGMLESGLSEETAATILSRTEISQEGEALLRRTGRTQESLAWLYPEVRQAAGRTALFSCMGAGVLGAVLFSGAVLFLKRREALYEQAAGILSRFAEGDFSRHLPRGGTGALYRLFSAADQLSRAAQVRGEAERAAKEALKNAVSDISHQLKTPLTSMQMMGELLAQPLPDEKRQEFSGILLRQLERLQWLVTSLLKLSRLDACAITFQNQRIDVHSWILEALEPIQELLREKALQVHIDAGDCQIETDPRWSKEALLNILKNAAEHTPPKGTIIIAARQTPLFLSLSVTDSGEGMDLEDQAHVFERFYRGKNAASDSVGIGMAMAKAILNAQQAEIQVHSTPGKGTCFTILFPSVSSTTA